MSNTLQTLIRSAQQLTPVEQIELINAVSQFLHQRYQQLPVPQSDTEQNDFWNPKSIEDIVANQQTKAVTDLASLKVDFWPEDESTDSVLEFIQQQRQEDCASQS